MLQRGAQGIVLCSLELAAQQQLPCHPLGRLIRQQQQQQQLRQQPYLAEGAPVESAQHCASHDGIP
jgi:hypothetical protein